jgi:hypothetical protein
MNKMYKCINKNNCYILLMYEGLTPSSNMRIIGQSTWEQDGSEIAGAREQAWHAHSCKCGSIAVYDEPSSNSHCQTQSADSAMSHTLGDIFEVRSCGAPFSGMNLGTNSSKSASATHPWQRFRTPSRVHQLAQEMPVQRNRKPDKRGGGHMSLPVCVCALCV